MTLITLPPGIDVESQLDGHLYCRTHRNKVWDKDVKQVITEGLDVEPLWALINEDDRYGPVSAMVPYIPEMECWAKVEIGPPTEPGGGAVASLLGRTLPTLDTAQTSGRLLRLGVLFPGEGRSVLRQMIHNWFIPEQYSTSALPIRLSCKATSHNPVRHNIFQQNLKDESKQWGERWLIYFTDTCYSCNKLKEEVADMVPNF